MTTPSWTAGTLYAPGAVVQRNTASAVVAQAPLNPGFESGDVNWTKGDGWEIGNFSADFDGVNTAKHRDFIGSYRIYSDTPIAVIPGLTLTASCQCRRGQDGMSGRVQLEWLTSGSVSIRIDNGNLIDSGVDKWKQSTVTGTAPATAAFVRVGATVTQNHNGRNFYVDAFQWNYAYSAPIDSLVFTATQAAPGYSGGTEPAWPTVLGGTVVDNEVTWTAIDSSTVTWEAAPILVSGPNEPSFPIETGATVADNTIIWTAIPRIVSDEKCPHSKVVAIAASKIFAADNDIIAYSATVNPLDWSTTDDAGYLPFGLQTHGANPVAAMGLYRSNLVAFNSTGFQMWQVDPDPQQMALLDAAPVGCRYYLSIKPFQNDLAFLSEVGIRNISIAGASTNLEAGVFGKPVDPLVKEKVNEADFEPFSMFVPTLGQFWMTWGPESLVMTTTGLKQMSWSRYVFPNDLDCMTIQTGDLYIRTVDHHIWRLDGDETADDVYCQPTPPVLFGEAYGLTVELQWYEAEYETPIVAYIVLRSVDGSLFVEIGETPGDVLTYTDVTVESGHVYYYMVVARPDPSGIDSDPSNQVVFEFEAVVVPGSSASVPTSEPPPEEECFNLYTTTAPRTRASADGFVIDPELQFETTAGKFYWMYGHLQFIQAVATGNPGAQVNFSHAGDTVTFEASDQQTAFHASTDLVASQWHPIRAEGLGATGYQAISDNNTTEIMHVVIDAILVVGASGGTFGIEWGLANIAALGSTTLLEGSYFTAIEVDAAP